MQIAYEICIEMLCQREYTIVDKEELKITARKLDGSTMCVFFIDSQFNADRCKEYVTLMHALNITHSIIINNGSITSSAKKTIECAHDIDIELFSIEELQTNITQHDLQPNFTRLTPSENTHFKRKYGIKIPTIVQTDPIAKFFHYKKGDIIRVERTNNIMYRIVK